MKQDKLLVNQPTLGNDQSFSIMVRPCIDLVFPYHMHTGYQLNLVIEGKGVRVVGDHSEEYTSGDLVLIGPNLPHYWTYDAQFQEEKGKGRAIIIHFSREFAGADFINKPELVSVTKLLEKAYRGLKIEGKLRERTTLSLTKMDDLSSLGRLVSLITMLADISQSGEYSFLAGPAFEKETRLLPDQELKIKRIKHFMNLHFTDSELSLSRLAQMAAMSATSFSKYFKKHTGQNYIEVLNNLRLSEACKLMGASDYTIAEIANQCGYNNLSNFNKLFKQQYRCTPKEFKAQIGKR